MHLTVEPHKRLAGPLAEMVRRLRTGRSWTLDELAARSGISRRLIVQVEQGEANPSIGTFVVGNQTPNAPAGPPVTYTVDANAFVPLAAGLPDCSPSNMQTSLTVTPGGSVTTATIAFTGCN